MTNTTPRTMKIVLWLCFGLIRLFLGNYFTLQQTTSPRSPSTEASYSFEIKAFFHICSKCLGFQSEHFARNQKSVDASELALVLSTLIRVHETGCSLTLY